MSVNADPAPSPGPHPPSQATEINTGGGLSVGGDVSTGGAFIGRDQITVNGYAPDDVARLLQAARQNSNALMALHDLLHSNHAVRDVVVAAKTTLKTSHAQVGRIGYTKGMHDLLQRIALTYNLLHPMLYEHNALRPTQDWRWTDSRRHCTALKNLIEELVNFSTRTNALAALMSSSLPGSTPEPWLDELGQLAQPEGQLQTANDAHDTERLDLALSSLRYILDTQPTHLNTRLMEAIRVMDTLQLTHTLSQVANDILAFKDKLDALALNRLDAFVGSIALVGQHCADLLRLRDAHDRWQDMDNRLRTEYAQLFADANRLRGQWHKRIGPRLSELLAGSPPTRIQDLQACVKTFEASFASGNIIEVRESLWELRSAVNRRFNQIDQDLKEVCQNLATASGPLGTVIESLN